MAKRKNTPVTSSTKRILVGTLSYPPLATGPCRIREVPCIRLSGEWLVRAGFNPHAVLTVRVTRGRIVVTAS